MSRLRTPSAGRRGSRWRRLERQVLERDGYVCRLRFEGCLGVATAADHWLPRSRFPELAEDPANLVAACRPCNSKKKDLLPSEAMKRFRAQKANGTRDW